MPYTPGLKCSSSVRLALPDLSQEIKSRFKARATRSLDPPVTYRVHPLFGYAPLHSQRSMWRTRYTPLGVQKCVPSGHLYPIPSDLLMEFYLLFKLLFSDTHHHVARQSTFRHQRTPTLVATVSYLETHTPEHVIHNCNISITLYSRAIYLLVAYTSPPPTTNRHRIVRPASDPSCADPSTIP
ncbi:hypothetical protein BS17DRAFT_241077 [Gyrodon lividus]|nr:hypothetical protein BS17DRAFT_241077 [Gyrodon lividus]